MMTLTLIVTGFALLQAHIWDTEKREDAERAARMREARVEREWEALAVESAATYSPRRRGQR
jgi:hypothetical protein